MYGSQNGSSPRRYEVAGGTYGIGSDYMVSDSIFVSLEVSHRELTHRSTNDYSPQTNDFDVISLRIGYKFN